MSDFERIAAEQVVRWKGALDLLAQGPCDGSCADPECWTRREDAADLRVAQERLKLDNGQRHSLSSVMAELSRRDVPEET